MPDPSLNSAEPKETEPERVRRIGRGIIDSIDLDHVHTMPGLVQVFQIARDRAQRELDLDKELKKPLA